MTDDHPQHPPGTVAYTTADILAGTDFEAIVNPVNCQGRMGAGLALQFARRYPAMLPLYVDACERRQLRPGSVLLYHRLNGTNPRIIVQFPTKDHWRSRSQIQWIETGLQNMYRQLIGYRVRSVALPALGAGLGGLPWPRVDSVIRAAAADHPQISTTVCLRELPAPPP